MGENIFVAAKTSAPVYASMTKTVIAGALVGVAQNVIGLGRALEILFCLRIIGIVVRVILEGKLAVCLFDLVVASAAANAQHLVVIKLHHGPDSGGCVLVRLG